jgi:hypothetical protein
MRCIAKTILVVTAFLLVQGLTASPPAAAEAKKRNLGIIGYHTPNMDRIAGEGALFTDAYAQQSCTAGRARVFRWHYLSATEPEYGGCGGITM